jgi:DNA-binding phage protein
VRFHAAIAAKAGKRGINTVARETGVLASTISRMKTRGGVAEVRSVLALCKWAGLNPMDYLVRLEAEQKAPG